MNSAPERIWMDTLGLGVWVEKPEQAGVDDIQYIRLDLHEAEVARLRADLRHVIDERDRTFALMLARAEKADAERDALWAALEEIADGLKGIARDIQIGPDDEGREIYDMVQAMQWDARQALKGHNQ